MEKQKANVLIIGGGIAGVELGRQMDKKYQVTIIERNKLFFNVLASVRVPLEPELVESVYLPYDNVLKNGKFIFSNVVEITPTQVVLEDNSILTFDYLILATGTNTIAPFRSPLDLFENNGKPSKQYFSNLNNEIVKSKHILIVGGGSVACEFIGEIYEKYGTSKKITMVHSHSKLVHKNLPESFQTKLNDGMKSRGVNLIFNERLTMPEEIKLNLKNQDSPLFQATQSKYVTNGGIEIEDVDLIFWTVGTKPNNESFKNHFHDKINESGLIIVNQHCQIKGFKNIFAIGDITNFPELKTAINAMYHARLVAKAIQLLSDNNNSDQVTLPIYTPSPYLSIQLSLGKNDGISTFRGWVIGSFLTKIFKSKEMYISQVIRFLNYPKKLNFD